MWKRLFDLIGSKNNLNVSLILEVSVFVYSFSKYICIYFKPFLKSLNKRSKYCRDALSHDMYSRWIFPVCHLKMEIKTNSQWKWNNSLRKLLHMIKFFCSNYWIQIHTNCYDTFVESSPFSKISDKLTHTRVENSLC